MPSVDKAIHSDIAWSDESHIVVRGLDFTSEILGVMDLGSFAFLQLLGRTPTDSEAKVFNAMIVTLVEHGVTPSVIAARMTYAGAPEALQAAVAAGLCGLGSVYVGSMEGAARMLSEALPADARPDLDVTEIARAVVAEYRADKRIVPGLGHSLHKPIDPRTPRLFELAEANGLRGNYVRLIEAIATEAEAATGRSLPVNATGAVGALSCELGISWQIVRGFGVMARAIGLVGHLLEESQTPMAPAIWHHTETSAIGHLVDEPATSAPGFAKASR